MINICMSDYTDARIALKATRQANKLAKAEADRIARNVVEPGRYPDVTADITQLPTQYGPVDNDPDNYVDNGNGPNLKTGRPWAP